MAPSKVALDEGPMTFLGFGGLRRWLSTLVRPLAVVEPGGDPEGGPRRRGMAMAAGPPVDLAAAYEPYGGPFDTAYRPLQEPPDDGSQDPDPPPSGRLVYEDDPDRFRRMIQVLLWIFGGQHPGERF